MLAALALLALAVGVLNLQRHLANPDEGRYSEISREMVESGDWVTPRLNGLKYFEKPPLQYWAAALAFEAFGANEVSAHLYVWLAAGLPCWWFHGNAQGQGSLAAMLRSLGPYFMLGGVVTLDMGLTLWTTATFAPTARGAPAARRRRRWVLPRGRR